MTPNTPPPTDRLESALREQEERLSHCVHCGFCLPVCPTYIELGDEADSPRGRLHLMQSVIEGRLDPASDAFQTHLDRCLGCRACESVCPSGVEYGFLLERARALAVERRTPTLVTRLLPRVMASGLLRAPFLAGGRMLRATGLPELLARRLPPRGRGAGLRLAMGMLATSRPRPWIEEGRPDVSPPPSGDAAAHPDARPQPSDPDAPHPAPSTAPAPSTPPAPGSRGRVALLEGCVQKGLFDHVNRATRHVLRVQGWEVVEVQGQGCCGALHAHSGALDRAREMVGRNVEAFGGAEIDHLVANAAGCGALLREMHELVPGDRAEALVGKVVDISELASDPGAPLGAPLPLKVAYDPPCHLHHAQRIIDPPLQLLERIPGVALVPIPDAEECCGGAGIYGITHEELGGAIGDRKVDRILSTGCDVVATGNPGCQMQIGAGLRARDRALPVLHPIELLSESYRRAGWR